MKPATAILAGLAIAATGLSAAEAQTSELIFANARTHMRAAPVVPARKAPPVLNLSTGTETAVAAAKAAQATTVETSPDATVQPVVVRPQAAQEGRVIASTDATPLTSPYFSAKDAEPPPLAIGLDGNSAAGKQRIDNRPLIGGLLAVNPDLTGTPVRGDLGVTTLF